MAIAQTVSAVNDASPQIASTALPTKLSFGLSNCALVNVFNTIAASSALSGSGSSRTTTSWTSSAGSLIDGQSSTSIRRSSLNRSRRFQIACITCGSRKAMWPLIMNRMVFAGIIAARTRASTGLARASGSTPKMSVLSSSRPASLNP